MLIIGWKVWNISGVYETTSTTLTIPLNQKDTHQFYCLKFRLFTIIGCRKSLLEESVIRKCDTIIPNSVHQWVLTRHKLPTDVDQGKNSFPRIVTNSRNFRGREYECLLSIIETCRSSWDYHRVIFLPPSICS